MESAAIWPMLAYLSVVVTMLLVLLTASYVLGERHTARAADEPFESGIVTVGYARLRLSAKYYLIAMFFVIFDVEALFIYAWAVAFRELGWTGYIEVLVFIGVLIAALAYLWRLGALDWAPSGQDSRFASRR